MVRIEALEQLETRCLLSGGLSTLADRVFIEPQAGRAPLLQAIASARREIRLTICNISDPIVVGALEAASSRGVQVRIIVDRTDYSSAPSRAPGGEQDQLKALASAGVSWRLSNPTFYQSFEKGLIIDGKEALIMSLCITPEAFADTRDVGLVTHRPGVIGEMASVFETDWANTNPGPEVSAPTPALSSPVLLWGPVSARSKLNQLITTARKSIDVTCELLGDPFLDSALLAAVARGVRVRVIVPEVVANNPPDNVNATAIPALEAGGVQIHVTSGIPSPANPYMHAKTLVVDGALGELGSIDLNSNVTVESRELGVLLNQPRLVRPLQSQFNSDWANTQPASL